MGLINVYGNPIITNWEIDDNGNKISVSILNEQKQVTGNKIVLEGLPDEQYRVFIDGLVEIDIKEKITEPNQFKVDYRKNGVIFVHESLDGQWININQYASRGMYYIPAGRIWTKIDEFGNVIETLDSVVTKIETISDVIVNLDNSINEANNLKTELEFTINNGEQLNDIMNNTIVLGESLKQELPLLVDNANNSKTDLENVISQSITTKNELNNTITNANNKISELSNTINFANEINDILSNPTTGTIKQAIDINNELKNTIQSSSMAKSDLETSIQDSINIKNSLDLSVSEAMNVKTGLDNSISEGNILKGELEDIISGTDLEQVITDISSLKQGQHNHTNKAVLDTITQTKIDNWDTVTNKVDKVAGKQLSTEDYTTTEKNKLAGIENNANNYTHPTTAGNKHIPTGGNVGQVLKNTASGTATWQNENVTPIANNLTETVEGKALDATQGKVLDDKIGILSVDIENINLNKADKTELPDISAKLDKSGDTIQNYREKLLTLTGLTPNIDLSQANVFKLILEGATTISISNPSIDVSQSFTLIIIQPATAQSINFPASVKWMNGQIPDLSTTNKTYYLLFDTIDNGVTWHGRSGGVF